MLDYKKIDVPTPTEPSPMRDMFTVAGRRRSFKPEEKARIVAESFASGQTVCAVARRHRLSASQLFAWRRDARRNGMDHAEKPAVAPEVSPHLPEIRGSERTTSPLEIAVGPAVVRVPQGVDAATLKLVLEALRQA